MKTTFYKTLCLLLLLYLCISVGCSQTLTTHQRVDGIYETTTEITHPDLAISHTVYVFSQSEKREKPPVLLLHELPGLNAATIEWAASLAHHFTVYVPLLFGSRYQNSLVQGSATYFFNGEWWERNELQGSRQITKWLHHLVKMIAQAHNPEQKIGIIGMCLTGALPLALLDNERVHAAVVAQPTLPFPNWSEEDKHDLGLSLEEWDHVMTKIDSDDGPYVYGVRFQGDKIADREKHIRMNTVLNSIRPGSFFDREVCFKEYEDARLEEKAHSTLIHEWQEDDTHPTEVRRREIKSFLLNPDTFSREVYTPADCDQQKSHME